MGTTSAGEQEGILANHIRRLGLGVWQWDFVQGTGWASRELRRMHGLAEEDTELRLEEFLGGIHPDDAAGVREAFAACERGEAGCFFETYRLLGERERFVQSIGRCVVGESGAVSLAGTSWEITCCQHLRPGDAFTRQVFEGLQANIAVIDREGVIRAVNRKWEAFGRDNSGGETSPMGIGSNYLGVCRRAAREGDPDGEKALQGIEAVLRGELRRFTHEYPCHSPTELRWFMMSVVPLEQGPVDGAMVAHLDVSERRLAEERLRASELRLRLATEAAGMFAWEGDLRLGTAIWSDNAAALLGCRPEDLPSKLQDSAFFIALEDRERVLGSFRAAVAHGRNTYSDEYRAASEPGSARFFRSDTRILYEKGEPVRVLGVTQDITERRIAEEALRESEERFRTLADNISQLAWMADESGSIFWYNRRWYEFTGTTLERMHGEGWRTVYHPDHLSRVEESWRKSIDAQTPWEDVFPLRGKDGGYRWFLSRALPIEDDEGKIVRWLGTNTDITQQRSAQEEIALHAEELVRANEELVRFNRAVVGRELRMIELKREVNELCETVGLPPRYRLDFDDNISPERATLEEIDES